ncbi:MAG TPA: dihydropteroate synthase [Acidimicrobiales bacterium]
MIPDVMGIVNVTPDSFSDGGRYLRVEDAVAHGLRLAAEGAAVIDIGGESTRPGAEPVDVDTELGRVIPVIERLRAETAGAVRISIDTRHAEVAQAAIAAGATLVNDVSASLYPVAADAGVGWVAMHMRGEPRTMQDDPRYDDVVAEVTAELADVARAAREAGVREVWVDPGIGFGKTPAHNWALLANLDRLVALGYPVLVGVSRKRFLGLVLAKSDGVDEPVPVDDRREASLAVATWAMMHGARMVRAHEVRMTVHAARVVAA